MTPLRTRMIEDMKLGGLAAKTQEVYLQAVSALAKHYKKSPELSWVLAARPASFMSSIIRVRNGVIVCFLRHQRRDHPVSMQTIPSPGFLRRFRLSLRRSRSVQQEFAE